MKLTFAATVWLALAASLRISAQDPQDQPAAAATSLPASLPASLPTPPAALPAERPISLKLLLPNTLNDQSRIYSFPGQVVRGHHWIPAAAVLGTTAALIALDNHEASYFRQTSLFHGFSRVFTGNSTAVGTILAPASLFAVGLARKDAKMTRTALFAAEAAADVEILSTALKDATNRTRPSGIPPKGNFSDTWFEHSSSPWLGRGGFPSGHTIAAFAVATVIARRYGNHRWVPYVAYGAAGLVGFSRLALSAHFLSDVFVGGALGYSVSRFVVLGQ